MPTVYRSMYAEGEYPVIGRHAYALGVRVNVDIHVTPDDRVGPGEQGMSVSRTWRELPAHRIPLRLKALCPKAAGNNRYACWKMGEGEFLPGALATALWLTVDKNRISHGLVGPLAEMSFIEYEAYLTATKTAWVRDEE